MFIDINTKMQDVYKRTQLLQIDRKVTGLELKDSVATNKTYSSIITSWFSGNLRLNVKRVMKIAEALDVSIDYLLVGHGSTVRISKLYSSILTLDEKDLFVNYQNMTNQNRKELLSKQKKMVPQNAFDQINSIERCNGDNEETEKELSERVVLLGSRIKEILNKQGVQQKEFAMSLDTHPALMCRFLSGERVMFIEMLLEICQRFHVYPSDLLCKPVRPNIIQGFEEDESQIIVYYRMLDTKDKGEILAQAKAYAEGF